MKKNLLLAFLVAMIAASCKAPQKAPKKPAAAATKTAYHRLEPYRPWMAEEFTRATEDSIQFFLSDKIVIQRRVIVQSSQVKNNKPIFGEKTYTEEVVFPKYTRVVVERTNAEKTCYWVRMELEDTTGVIGTDNATRVFPFYLVKEDGAFHFYAIRTYRKGDDPIFYPVEYDNQTYWAKWSSQDVVLLAEPKYAPKAKNGARVATGVMAPK